MSMTLAERFRMVNMMMAILSCVQFELLPAARRALSAPFTSLDQRLAGELASLTVTVSEGGSMLAEEMVSISALARVGGVDLSPARRDPSPIPRAWYGRLQSGSSEIRAGRALRRILAGIEYCQELLQPVNELGAVLPGELSKSENLGRMADHLSAARRAAHGIEEELARRMELTRVQRAQIMADVAEELATVRHGSPGQPGALPAKMSQ